MLGTRILTAVILIPLVLAALFLLAPVGWGTVSLVLVGIAASEWASLAGYARSAQTLFVAATVAIGIGVLILLAAGEQSRWADVVVVSCGAATVFWVIVAPPWLAFRWKPASGVALAVVGWVALTGAWVALVALQARSPWLVLAAMAIVWIADTAAYFAGRAFGKHKLAPQVSPGKTWEGVYGALAAVAIYALALTPFAEAAGRTGAPTPLAVGIWVACALALAALSVEGDLFESLLKRNAGVKDSGRILPGHGGILDRIDALIAAMPAAALLAHACLR
ncbi:MAG TPA: phosphatidate cytidylyltransferase [Casimicrobiaceae bacterium]|nr:phosphatidate cytidylyltransferase [Casimicrobiaceae bacterium]